MTRRVAVLMGGISAERDVSLSTAAGVIQALRELGYPVEAIDVTGDVAALVARLQATRPDVVFNALHGRYGEDGCVQGLLELLGLPYTHSGVRASAIAMDKGAARRVFAAEGLPCAEGLLVHRTRAHDVLPRPYVVKPIAEGSSVGVMIVHEGANAPPLEREIWPHGDMVLVERFVPGREITVAVMGDRPLGVLEIQPRHAFYDYDAKYVPGESVHVMPAPLPADVYAEAERIALVAHQALGCRGITRADLRYDDRAQGPAGLYLLEVNTQPGMTPTSLVPEIAAWAGIGFNALVGWMVEHAQCDG